MNYSILLRFENRQLTPQDIVTLINDSGSLAFLNNYSNNFKFDTQCIDGTSRYTYSFYDISNDTGWRTGVIHVRRIGDVLTIEGN